MANYRKRLLTDSPTGPSFSTARRRDPKTSATLEKPLTRESLVALTTSFDVGGQPLVCRADASPTEDPCKSGQYSEPHAASIQFQDNAHLLVVSTKKSYKMMKLHSCG